MRCSIDTRLFAAGGEKRSIIGYMLRKNGRHSAAVVLPVTPGIH
ncbi:hypothetical protein [Paraburkholderia sp. BCC1884]|nr:hypothetical protein [Paraburkholderia sp. BCC1884]